MTNTPPLISVIMANFRGASFIGAAIRSVLCQSHGTVEVIVSDDASDDESCDIVRQIASGDPRVRLIEAARRGGPARARNAALEAAKGDWIAIVDSDDLVEPDRLARMLGASRTLNADMVADDMVPFGNVAAQSGTMYGALLAQGPYPISAVDLIVSDRPGGRSAPLGYTKALIRRAALGDLRYDETLHNSEDFDLYLRLLLNGARFVLLPQATYLYRRHSASISHRLSVDVLIPLIEAHDKLPPTAPEIATALKDRRKRLARALEYARLVDALKSRDAGGALLLLLRYPVLLTDLAESVRDRRRQRRASAFKRQ